MLFTRIRVSLRFRDVGQLRVQLDELSVPIDWATPEQERRCRRKAKPWQGWNLRDWLNTGDVGVDTLRDRCHGPEGAADPCGARFFMVAQI